MLGYFLSYFVVPLVVPFIAALVVPGWRSLVLLALVGGGLSVWGFNDVSKDGGLGGAIGSSIVFAFTCGLGSGVVIRAVILGRSELR